MLARKVPVHIVMVVVGFSGFWLHFRTLSTSLCFFNPRTVHFSELELAPHVPLMVEKRWLPIPNMGEHIKMIPLHHRDVGCH